MTKKCTHDKQKAVCRECGGSQICEHDKIKASCKKCGGSQICEHQIQKLLCKKCGGSQICEHHKQKSTCKKCLKDDKLLIYIFKTMISSSKRSDKRKGIFDESNFITFDFLKNLFDNSDDKCSYINCKKTFLLREYQNDMISIERIDDSIGHTKSNIIFSCLGCNLSQMTIDKKKKNLKLKYA